MTLDEWVRHGEAQLAEGPHPDRARRDAEALLLHHIGKNRAWLMAHGEEEFAGCRAVSSAGLLKRRVRGEPIQYITGETEFYGLPFRVTRDVLIPRPETEHLVEKVGQLIPTFDRRPKRTFEIHRLRPAWENGKNRPTLGDPDEAGWPPRILDVGTGSGAIAISIAHDWSGAEITAIDISSRALEIARGNAKRIGFTDHIRFLQGDLLAPVSGEKFELVVSNPPYVSTQERTAMDVEVREYEPETALFAGEDGLDVYRRLIPQTADALAPGGYLVLEIGYGQQAAVQALLEASGYEAIEFVPDLQGIARVAVGRRSR